jgi:hypothetical protein
MSGNLAFLRAAIASVALLAIVSPASAYRLVIGTSPDNPPTDNPHITVYQPTPPQWGQPPAANPYVDLYLWIGRSLDTGYVRGASFSLQAEPRSARPAISRAGFVINNPEITIDGLTYGRWSEEYYGQHVRGYVLYDIRVSQVGRGLPTDVEGDFVRLAQLRVELLEPAEIDLFYLVGFVGYSPDESGGEAPIFLGFGDEAVDISTGMGDRSRIADAHISYIVPEPAVPVWIVAFLGYLGVRPSALLGRRLIPFSGL